MAKFNKDTFLNEITSKVQSAIDKNLLTREDVDKNDTERLHGFIQYELLEYIEDRKFAVDVLKDFNYDEKAPWANLQNEYGTFKSLMDIALVNLWLYLKNSGCLEYGFYSHDNNLGEAPMLNQVHQMEFNDEPDKISAGSEDETSEGMPEDDNIGFDAVSSESDNEEENESAEEIKNEHPRRSFRLSRNYN